MTKRSSAWISGAFVLGAGMALTPLLPQQIILYVVTEGLAIVFCLLAALKTRAVWWIAAGFICFFIGDLTYVGYDLIFHVARSFPNWGDIFYLAFYPLTAIGLFKLISRNLNSTLDSLLIVLGVAIPWWLFVEYPNIVAAGYTFIERSVTVAYPLGDMILLFLAIRALFFKISPYIFYLCTGLVVLTLTDTVYSIMQLNGTFHHGSYLDYGWFLFYVLWGLAFLCVIPSTKAEPLPHNSDFRIALRVVSNLFPLLSVSSILFISADVPNLVGSAVIVLSLCIVSGWRMRREEQAELDPVIPSEEKT